MAQTKKRTQQNQRDKKRKMKEPAPAKIKVLDENKENVVMVQTNAPILALASPAIAASLAPAITGFESPTKKLYLSKQKELEDKLNEAVAELEKQRMRTILLEEENAQLRKQLDNNTGDRDVDRHECDISLIIQQQHEEEEEEDRTPSKPQHQHQQQQQQPMSPQPMMVSPIPMSMTPASESIMTIMNTADADFAAVAIPSHIPLLKSVTELQLELEEERRRAAEELQQQQLERQQELEKYLGFHDSFVASKQENIMLERRCAELEQTVARLNAELAEVKRCQQSDWAEKFCKLMASNDRLLEENFALKTKFYHHAFLAIKLQFQQQAMYSAATSSSFSNDCITNFDVPTMTQLAIEENVDEQNLFQWIRSKIGAI